MIDTLRMYSLNAELPNNTDEQVRALFVKALILMCREHGPQPIARMWLDIANDRNWLTPEELEDCEHILTSQ